MSDSNQNVCRRCRVEKTKLFLKGNKCLTDKCPVERRAYAPGQHGRARRRILGYGIQLREKQKLKRYFGMTEKQFRLFFKRAEERRGITGENLLVSLERRLDNVIYLMGFSESRTHARQLISHGHFLVDDRRVNVPSFPVEVGNVITFADRSAQSKYLKALVDSHKGKTLPGWLQVDREAMTGRVLALPTRADVTLPIEEHLVVELYSK